MKQKSNTAKWFWRSVQMSLVALVGFLVVAALGSDRTVSMERVVPSPFAADKIGAAVHFMSNWPRWHHFAKSAERLGFRDQPVAVSDQYAVPGALILLTVDPKDKPWKRFTLKLEVTEYVPYKKISLRLLEDSTGKITKLLDQVSWSIEIIPNATEGSTIHASVSGHTKSWRSRLFGRVASRILLNQILAADVVALGTIDDPLALNPAAAFQQ